MSADRAALYTLKPTIDLVSQKGIIPISHLCDSAGPMAKSAAGVANLLDVRINPSKTTIPDGGYTRAATGLWGDIRVGVLDPDQWIHGDPPVKYVKEANEQIVSNTWNPYAASVLLIYYSQKISTLPMKRLGT